MSSKASARKYCVITPYYKESRDLLEHCLDSVARQSVAADHIVIADGFPQDWLDERDVRHIRLDRAHADYGNLARGIGSMLAISEKYDGICFLDADNWYDDDHLETCLAAAATKPGADYVVAQRNFVRPDRSVMTSVTPADVPYADHVDTNCYLFLPGSFHLLHYWCTIPQELGTHGDMLFNLILKNYLPGGAPVTSHRTVKYLCMFEGVYLDKGEVPPPGTKPFVDWNTCTAWLAGLSDRDFDRVQKLTGLSLPRGR